MAKRGEEDFPKKKKKVGKKSIDPKATNVNVRTNTLKKTHVIKFWFTLHRIKTII